MKIEKPGLYKTRGGIVVPVVQKGGRDNRWVLSTLNTSHITRTLYASIWENNGVPIWCHSDHKDALVEEITDPVLLAFYED